MDGQTTGSTAWTKAHRGGQGILDKLWGTGRIFYSPKATPGNMGLRLDC